MTYSLLKDFVYSSLAFLFHPHALTSGLAAGPLGFPIVKPSLPETTAYRRLALSHRDSVDQVDVHAQYWWESSGFTLAILLDKAGYSSDAQHKLLQFVWAIVPYLGLGHLPGHQKRWKSFMTDDHNPIELSWDWRSGGAAPKIRFSIEPVGVYAGTSIDPHNQYAASKLRKEIAWLIPHTNLKWLDHFQQYLSGDQSKVDLRPNEGHLSTEFYAFDLNGDGSVMSKAYFFPGFRARTTSRSNFEVIKDAIETAPECTPEKLAALRIFHDYVENESTPPLEMDMLAIDLVDPADSRFKIYFRVRDTSFASVRDAISLGGRIRTPGLDQGLNAVRRLYHALLGGAATVEAPDGDVPSDDTQLPKKDHRTAGILYNVEFRYGSKKPKVKAYLPVRHYAQSEEAVMRALAAHFEDTQRSADWRANMTNYKAAVRTIL